MKIFRKATPILCFCNRCQYDRKIALAARNGAPLTVEKFPDGTVEVSVGAETLTLSDLPDRCAGEAA